MRALFPAARRELASGAVPVPAWLDPHRRQRLVAACRESARGPGPLHAATLPGGGRTSVRLGRHWRPHRDTRAAEDAGGGPVPAPPGWLAPARVARRSPPPRRQPSSTATDRTRWWWTTATPPRGWARTGGTSASSTRSSPGGADRTSTPCGSGGLLVLGGPSASPTPRCREPSPAPPTPTAAREVGASTTPRVTGLPWQRAHDQNPRDEREHDTDAGHTHPTGPHQGRAGGRTR